MKPINCIIIDDEELDLFVIEEYVSDYNYLNLLGSYRNVLESIELLKTKDIDLLFMDIDMPVINGVDFLKKIENPPYCIFITSHVEYALEAFDLHAIDYLLKPIKKVRFDIAVKRAYELFSIQEKALSYELIFEKETIIIKEGNSINKVLINDIVYLEALTNYTKVVTNTRRYITLQNLKNFLNELPQEKFVRIHRSYAVAKNKIKKLQQGEIFLEDFKLPLGKTYRKDVSRILSENI